MNRFCNIKKILLDNVSTRDTSITHFFYKFGESQLWNCNTHHRQYWFQENCLETVFLMNLVNWRFIGEEPFWMPRRKSLLIAHLLKGNLYRNVHGKSHLCALTC